MQRGSGIQAADADSFTLLVPCTMTDPPQRRHYFLVQSGGTQHQSFRCPSTNPRGWLHIQPQEVLFTS